VSFGTTVPRTHSIRLLLDQLPPGLAGLWARLRVPPPPSVLPGVLAEETMRAVRSVHLTVVPIRGRNATQSPVLLAALTLWVPRIRRTFPAASCGR
jgi:hypothetical protein